MKNYNFITLSFHNIHIDLKLINGLVLPGTTISIFLRKRFSRKEID